MMNGKSRHVGAVSLGCSKNRVDTERMLGLLQEAGYGIVSDPAEAEIIVINTCGFIEPAKQESIDAILEYARYKETANCETLVVTGCLSQRYREELMQELPEVDIFLGVREYERLPGLLDKTEKEARLGARLLTTPPYSAYLRIADGCSNRCAYCAIPLIRGPLVSVPMEDLIREAQTLVGSGVTELTLIAQDTSGYGRELYGRPMLLPLMKEIVRIPELHWLRLLYTYPDTVTPELIGFMRENEKICNYLDMPLQHTHDAVLARMNRRGDRAHIERVLQYIREQAPGFILRTTMMVGFPGETEEEFQSMLAFLREYPFDRLGAFAFSPEEDTKAAELPDQVPEEVKAQRLDALMSQQKALSKARGEKRIGSTAEVLLTGFSGKWTVGRSYAEAPEVDGRVLLPRAGHHKPGEYVFAKITCAAEYDVYGEELL